jgi:magnesium-transporting ATPase (P-type)
MQKIPVLFLTVKNDSHYQMFNFLYYFKEHGSYRLFVKGAPEKIYELSSPSTIPRQFNKIMDFYAENGYRVIALAAKNLPNLSDDFEQLN